MLELAELKQLLLPTQESMLDEIARLDNNLFLEFSDKFMIQTSLTRSMVSFQANKIKPIYRWYKWRYCKKVTH